MKEFLGTGIGMAIGFGSIILPVYAAVKDIQAGNIVWGLVDFFTIIPGVIRGLMYLFGGL